MTQSQQNLPALRFPEFSEEWKIRKLGDFCEFTQGVQIPRSEQLKKHHDGYIRYLYIRDFFTDNFLYYVKNQYPTKIIKENEIMVVNTGNTAGKAFKGKKGVLSNNAFKISFDQKFFNSNFLFIVLTSEKIQRQIKGFFNSGGQPHLGHKNIALVSIGIPSDEEQKKIAGFLSAVDERIEQITRKKALLEQYKKGMMQKLFSQELRFKDNNGNPFPDWEEKQLGDIAEFKKGKGIAKSDIDDNGQNKCIRYGELYTKYREIIKTIVSQTNTKKEKSVLSEENDILMPTSDVTPNGLATASALDKSGIILGGDILIIRSKNILNSYFSYFVAANKNKIIRLVSGVTVYHIYGSDMATLQLNIPALPEQQKISDFLSSLDDKINLITTELTQAQEFKKGLLQQMFV